MGIKLTASLMFFVQLLQSQSLVPIKNKIEKELAKAVYCSFCDTISGNGVKVSKKDFVPHLNKLVLTEDYYFDKRQNAVIVKLHYQEKQTEGIQIMFVYNKRKTKIIKASTIP